MLTRRTVFTAVALLAMAIGLDAQQTTTTKTPGTSTSATTKQLSGEVIWTQGNLLVAKMLPDGGFRLFDIPPGTKFMIDGQPKLINELKVGTVLTASVVTTETPVTVRTTTITNGTVEWVNGNYVVLRLASGENKSYTVPEDFKFMVEGKPVTVREIKQGMKINATKIVENSHTELSTKTVITGKAPK
jgi:hypothetical protein